MTEPIVPVDLAEWNARPTDWHPLALKRGVTVATDCHDSGRVYAVRIEGTDDQDRPFRLLLKDMSVERLMPVLALIGRPVTDAVKQEAWS